MKITVESSKLDEWVKSWGGSVNEYSTAWRYVFERDGNMVLCLSRSEAEYLFHFFSETEGLEQKLKELKAKPATGVWPFRLPIISKRKRDEHRK